MIEIEQTMSQSLSGHIRKGSQGYVRVGKNRYPAEILDVRERVVRCHCVVPDVPRDGAGVVLEFDTADSKGVNGYYARVLTASPESLHEIVLLRAANLNREELRTRLRVPTDIALTVHANGLSTPVTGRLLNLSTIGAYIETTGPIGQNGQSRVSLQMTEDPELQVSGEIVHSEEKEPGTGIHRIGVRFSEVDPKDARAISWYVWSRVRSFFQDNG